MALNINGTTGISGVDGSASAPALTGTDSNTGINFASDTVNINTGGSTRATVDSSGNLGIGTTSPSFKLTVSSAENNLFLKQDSGDHGYILDVNQGDGSLAFNRRLSGSDTQRIRISSDGHVGIRTSATNTENSNSANFNTSGYLTLNHINTESSGRAYLAFNYNAGEIGTVTQSGTSGVSYNTSSDYRLKENIVALSDGITRLKTLKPSRFNFKTEKDRTVDGFIAHEVTAVPEAITGTKDEVDSDNKPVYQGIDQSKLVPLLTAALQEAVAKIEVLETKVAALEAG